jgi:hypothetical protein
MGATLHAYGRHDILIDPHLSRDMTDWLSSFMCDDPGDFTR